MADGFTAAGHTMSLLCPVFLDGANAQQGSPSKGFWLPMWGQQVWPRWRAEHVHGGGGAVLGNSRRPAQHCNSSTPVRPTVHAWRGTPDSDTAAHDCGKRPLHCSETFRRNDIAPHTTPHHALSERRTPGPPLLGPFPAGACRHCHCRCAHPKPPHTAPPRRVQLRIVIPAPCAARVATPPFPLQHRFSDARGIIDARASRCCPPGRTERPRLSLRRWASSATPRARMHQTRQPAP